MAGLARQSRRWAGLVSLLACIGASSQAAAQQSPCAAAIHGAEQAVRLPPKLLDAIGVVESGRPDPVSRRIVPWPWTINVEGTGFFYDTREDAVAAVVAARAAGRRSIDVGCMQINLMHHPNAFASLEEAFDPHANASYAAAFLQRLFWQTRDWGNAAAAYHSQTPGVADDYRRRVVSGWSNAAEYGVTNYAATGASGRFPASSARVRPEPLGGYTAEFRARLAQDAADRRRLETAMGMLQASSHGARHPPAYAAQHRPMLQASLRG